MKSLVEKLNESLYADINDQVTREYNNTLGMFSNTLLKKLPCANAYILVGSKFKEGYDWMLSRELKGESVSDWIEKCGFSAWTPAGENIFNPDEMNDSEEFEKALECAIEYCKDSDYIIVM